MLRKIGSKGKHLLFHVRKIKANKYKETVKEKSRRQVKKYTPPFHLSKGSSIVTLPGYSELTDLNW